MRRDPHLYSQPDQFNPDRFLGDSPELDPSTYVFGCGRRRCPGELLADNMRFVICARALAVLQISQATDTNGVELTPSSDYFVGKPML
jgi:cytochrome P450